MLATVEVANPPRVGEHINTVARLLVVTAVTWDLTDGPLLSARVICAVA